MAYSSYLEDDIIDDSAVAINTDPDADALPDETPPQAPAWEERGQPPRAYIPPEKPVEIAPTEPNPTWAVASAGETPAAPAEPAWIAQERDRNDPYTQPVMSQADIDSSRQRAAWTAQGPAPGTRSLDTIDNAPDTLPFSDKPMWSGIPRSVNEEVANATSRAPIIEKPTGGDEFHNPIARDIADPDAEAIRANAADLTGKVEETVAQWNNKPWLEQKGEVVAELGKQIAGAPAYAAETLARAYLGDNWATEEKNKPALQKWIESRKAGEYVPTEADKGKKAIDIPFTENDVNMDTLKTFSQQLGYSLAGAPVAAIAGVAGAIGGGAIGAGGGPAAAALGAKIGAWAAGTTAAEYVMRKSTENQKLQEIHDSENEISKKLRGRPLTEDEWAGVKAKTESERIIQGFAESVPEVLGDVAVIGAAYLPVAKLPIVGRMATTWLGKFVARTFAMAGSYFVEQGTETLTQTIQNASDYRLGFRETPGNIKEAWNTVMPTTMLLTGVMGGGARVTGAVAERAKFRFNTAARKAYEDLEAGNAWTRDVEQMAKDSTNPKEQAMLEKAAKIGQKVYTPEEMQVVAFIRMANLIDTAKGKPTKAQKSEIKFLIENINKDSAAMNVEKVGKYYGILVKAKPGGSKVSDIIKTAEGKEQGLPEGPQSPWTPPGPNSPWTPPGPSSDWLPPGPGRDYMPPGPRSGWLPPGPHSIWNAPGPSSDYLPPGPRSEWPGGKPGPKALPAPVEGPTMTPGPRSGWAGAPHKTPLITPAPVSEAEVQKAKDIEAENEIEGINLDELFGETPSDEKVEAPAGTDTSKLNDLFGTPGAPGATGATEHPIVAKVKEQGGMYEGENKPGIHQVTDVLTKGTLELNSEDDVAAKMTEVRDKFIPKEKEKGNITEVGKNKAGETIFQFKDVNDEAGLDKPIHYIQNTDGTYAVEPVEIKEQDLVLPDGTKVKTKNFVPTGADARFNVETPVEAPVTTTPAKPGSPVSKKKLVNGYAIDFTAGKRELTGTFEKILADGITAKVRDDKGFVHLIPVKNIFEPKTAPAKEVEIQGESENEYVNRRLQEIEATTKLKGEARQLYLMEWKDKLQRTYQSKHPKPAEEKVPEEEAVFHPKEITTKAGKKLTYVGNNKTGSPLYEDENGVRSIRYPDGVLATESVSIVPTRDGVKTERGQREPEYEVEGEQESPALSPDKISGLRDDRRIIGIVSDHLEGLINEGIALDNRDLQTRVASYFGLSFSEFVKHPDFNARTLYNIFEYAMIKYARGVVKEGLSRRDTYNKLQAAYDNQPLQSARNSTTVELQQFSTPIHLSYLMQLLTDELDTGRTLEPTLGNGMLVFLANPRNVWGIELDPERASIIRDQLINVVWGDARNLDSLMSSDEFNNFIANPPFGALGAEVKIDGYPITKLDHLIIALGLKKLSNDGNFSFIIGGQNFKNGVMTDTDRVFLNWLYNNFNVTSNIEIPGKAYARQGAAYPVRLIIGQGKRETPNDVYAPRTPAEVSKVNNIDDIMDNLQEIRNGKIINTVDSEGASELDSLQKSNGPVASAGAESNAAELSEPVPGPSDATDRGLPGEAGDIAGQHAGVGTATGVGLNQPGGRAGSDVSGRGMAEAERTAGPTAEERDKLRAAKERAEPTGANVGPNKRGRVQGRTGESRLEGTTGRYVGDVESDNDIESVNIEASSKNAGQGKTAAEAAQLISDMVKEVGLAAGKTWEGVSALFGPPQRARMGLDFDNETYQKAKPLFVEAWGHWHAAGKKAKEFFDYMKGLYGEKILPYLRRWFEEMQQSIRQKREPVITAHQVTYESKSKSPAVDETLSPKNMYEAVQAALDAVEKSVGNIDDFVQKELQYETQEEMFEVLSGDQIDAIALTLYNFKNGTGIIIGDQTGFGKGRQAAAIYRWAALNGRKVVFFTEKPNLFTDFYRDIVAIGFGDKFKPLIIASNPELGAIYDQEGKVQHTIPSAAEKKKILDALAANGSSAMGDKNIMLITYSQINKAGNNVQRAISLIAKENIVILDESHNAAGDSNTGAYMKDLISHAQGVMYMSATSFKRPENMQIYYKTSLSKANMTLMELIQAIKNGGTTLQEVLSAALAKIGEMVRREKSFKGIDIRTEVSTKTRAEDEIVSDKATAVLRSILAFSTQFNDLVKHLSRSSRESIFGHPIPGSIMEGNKQIHSSVTGANFASVVHNAVRQLLLAMKTKQVTAFAIERWKAGEKPIIAVSNTFGSFIEDQVKHGLLKEGELFDIKFGEVLKRHLRRSLQITIKSPQNIKVHFEIDPAQLPSELQALYRQIVKDIDYANIDAPGSPLDYMLGEMQKATNDKGEHMAVAEITNRNFIAKYEEGKPPTLYKRTEQEKSGRNKIIYGFNNGTIDGLIINAAGATGLSVHVAKEFKDKRQRHYVGAQAEGNVDTEVQKMGRINRKGQLKLPLYTHFRLDVPAEIRPASILVKKLQSLSANTTANSDSPLASKTFPDLFNKYGNKVVGEWLKNHPDISLMMGVDPTQLPEDTYVKVSGRVALLPVVYQRQFYEEIEEEFNTVIEYEKEMGTYDLNVELIDYKAETLTKKVLAVGKELKNYFGSSVYEEKLSVDVPKQPFNAAKVQELIDEAFAGYTGDRYDWPSTYQDAYLDGIKKQAEAFIEEKKKEAEAKAIVTGVEKAYDENPVRDSLKHLELVLDRFHVGYSYRLYPSTSDDTYMFGVLVGIKQSKTTQNPATPGKTSLVFAVNNSMQKWTVPLSQLASMRVGAYDEKIPGHWDRTISALGLKQIRYMITGNLLQGFNHSPPNSKMVQFTRADGTTEYGILYPLLYDPKKADDIVRITEEQAVKVAKQGVDLVSDNIEVNPAGRGIRVFVPKLKQAGGVYFLDKQLRDMADNGEFTSVGNRMVGTFNSSTIERVVRRLHELGAAFDLERKVFERIFPNEAKAPETESDSASSFSSVALKDSFAVDDKGKTADKEVRKFYPDMNDAEKLEIDQAIADISKKLGISELIRAVDTYKDLPPRLQADYLKTLQRGFLVRGYYSDDTGEVYVIKANIDSVEGAKEVIIHEVFGHKGAFQAMRDLGYNVDSFLERIASQYGPEILKDNPTATLVGRSARYVRAAEWWAEEVTKGRWQHDSKFRQLWDYFVRMVNTAMRNMGINRKFTESEIADIMRYGRDAERLKTPNWKTQAKQPQTQAQVNSTIRANQLTNTTKPFEGDDYPQGHCYRNAAKFAMKIEGDYIEGMLKNPANGHILAHAWVEKDGVAYDPTLKVVMNAKNFTADYVVKEFGRMSGQQAVVRGIRENKWGPFMAPATDQLPDLLMNAIIGDVPEGTLISSGTTRLRMEDELSLPKIMKDIVGNDPPRMVVMETIQNSIDARKKGQTDLEIFIKIEEEASDNPDDRQLLVVTVADNASGMTKKETEEFLMGVGAKGKGGITDIGGYGFAKAGLFLMPKKVVVETVKNGIKTIISGTREDYMTNRSLSEEYTTSQRDGTSFKMWFYSAEEDARVHNTYHLNNWSINQAFKDFFRKDVLIPGVTFKYLNAGYNSENVETFTMKAPSEFTQVFPKDKITINGNDIVVYYVPDNEPKNRNGNKKYEINIDVSNKGLGLQISRWSWNNVTEILVPVQWKALVYFAKTPETTHVDYPFLNNRQTLNYEVQRKIGEAINAKIEKINEDRKKKVAKDFAIMMKNSPTIGGVKVLIPFTDKDEFDATVKLIKDNKETVAGMAKIFLTFQSVLGEMAGVTKLLDLVMTVDPKVHGFRATMDIHGHAFYALNPFAVSDMLEMSPSYIEVMKLGYDPAVAQSANLVHTLIHEYAHDKGGHGDIAWHQELGALYTQLTHRALGETVEELGRQFYEQFGQNLRDVQSNLATMGSSGSQFRDSSDVVQSPGGLDERGIGSGQSVQGVGERGSAAESAEETGDTGIFRDEISIPHSGTEAEREQALHDVENNPNDEAAAEKAFTMNTLETFFARFMRTGKDGKRQFDSERFFSDTGIELTINDPKDLYPYVRWFQTMSDLARNYPEMKMLFDAQQESISEIHQATINDRKASAAYYDLPREKRNGLNMVFEKGDARNRVYSNKELTDMGMDEDQIKGYWAIRKLLDKKLVLIARRIISDVLGKNTDPETISALVTAIWKRNNDLARLIKDTPSYTQNRDKILSVFMEKLTELKITKPEHINALTALADWTRARRAYMPHVWKGEWLVKVVDKNGVEAMHEVKTYAGKYLPTRALRRKAATEAAARTVMSIYGKQSVRSSELVHARETPQELFDVAKPGVMKSIIDSATYKIMNDFEKTASAADAVFMEKLRLQVNEYIDTLYHGMGWARHLISRKGTLGYRNDFENVIADYLMGFNAFAAKGNAARKFSEVMGDIDARKTPELWKQGKEYVSDMLTTDNDKALAYKKLLTFYFIAGKVSAATLNMTQNWTHADALLKSIESGTNSEKDLAKAMSDVSRTYLEHRKNKGKEGLRFTYESKYISPDEAEAILHEYQKGGLDPQYFGEISGFHDTNIYSGYSNSSQQFLFKLFTGAEAWNRVSTFLAAYRRSIAAGYGKDAAADKASWLTGEAHFIYGKGNRPGIVRKLGLVGDLAYTFMTYPFQNIVFIKHRIEDLMAAETPEAKSKYKQVIATNLAWLFILGGLQGLPFMWLATAIYKVLNDPEDDWDKLLYKYLPKPAARAIVRGLPSVIGADMSKKVEGTDIVGIPYGFQAGKAILSRYGKSKAYLDQYDYTSAFFHIMPDMVLNPYKALMGYREGGKTKRGGPAKLSAGEAVGQSMGFMPTSTSEALAVADITKRKNEARLNKTGEFANSYNKALQDKDQKRMSGLWKDVMKYNTIEQAKGREGTPVSWKDVRESAKRRTETAGKSILEKVPLRMRPFEQEQVKQFGLKPWQQVELPRRKY